MMNTRLERSQLEKIETRYHNHPLLLACQEAFRTYQARMLYLLFSPTEVFVEAVDIIDNILDESTNPMEYVHDLWENLTIRYKLWPTTARDEEEYQTAVSCVLYVVAVALSLHSDPFFHDTVKDSVLNEITSHKSVVKEEEDRVVVILSSYADELEAWMEEYSVSKNYLSEEIMCIAKGKKAVFKTIKAKTKRTRTEIVKTAFCYSPKGVDDASKNVRLSEVFNRLKAQSLIDAKSNLKEFLAVFSGEDVTIRIAWTGNDNVLHYLFDEWVNKRQYIPKPKGGLWKVVAARFYHREKDSEGVLYDENYTSDQLRKTANPTNISDDLETIIEMLKPDIRTRRFTE